MKQTWREVIDVVMALTGLALLWAIGRTLWDERHYILAIAYAAQLAGVCWLLFANERELQRLRRELRGG